MRKKQNFIIQYIDMTAKIKMIYIMLKYYNYV